MSSPALTLVTIPTEIRLRILRYALDEAEEAWGFPNVISLYRTKHTRPRPRGKARFYGTRAMSALFLISRQLHDEVEEILYTRFIFIVVHHGINQEMTRSFVEPLSPRAKSLFREVAVNVTFYLGFLQSGERLVKDNAMALQRTKNEFEYIRHSLTGLKKVLIIVQFAGRLIGGPEDVYISSTSRRRLPSRFAINQFLLLAFSFPSL